MHPAKRFCNMAIPADGNMRAHSVLQALRGNFVPLDGFAIGTHHGGRVIVPMDVLERLVAVGTGLALVPTVHNVPDQAGFGGLFDLSEAVLRAILPLRPAGAVTQAEVVAADSGIEGCRASRDTNGGRTMRFRAGNDALAAEFQISAKVTTEANRERDDGCEGKSPRERSSWQVLSGTLQAISLTDWQPPASLWQPNTPTRRRPGNCRPGSA